MFSSLLQLPLQRAKRDGVRAEHVFHELSSHRQLHPPPCMNRPLLRISRPLLRIRRPLLRISRSLLRKSLMSFLLIVSLTLLPDSCLAFRFKGLGLRV